MTPYEENDRAKKHFSVGVAAAGFIRLCSRWVRSGIYVFRAIYMNISQNTKCAI